MKQFILPFTLSLLSLSLLSACGDDKKHNNDSQPPPAFVDPSENTFKQSLFSNDSATVTNNYYPLKPGVTLTYLGESNDEIERVEVTVSHETRMVDGVLSRIVVDRAYINDELVEETFDWYAQDKDGNVWYMGEESYEIEDGEIVSTDGSWESGKDIDNTGSLAVAGIKFKTAPFVINDTYQQEFYADIAEDQAKIVNTNVDVTLTFPITMVDGSEVSNFTTLQLLEWVPLDADPVSTEEFKYFAPGIGMVLETNTEGDDRVELIEIHDDTRPIIRAADFTNPTVINNPLFPLEVGSTYRYQTTVGEDEELIIIEVLDETREVMGITTRVVRDRVYIDGDETTGTLIEDTYDWYAQDNYGNVWYMGETVDNYDEDGEFANHDGSWEAGVDGAYPGIQMKAAPRRGDSYHQEYQEGEAEDIAAVVETDVKITLENGTSYTTIKFKEWNPLEEDSTEFKYYAPGVGFVREEKLSETGEIEETVELTTIVTM